MKKAPDNKALFNPRKREHYFGAADFGRYLGWSRKRVNVYYQRDQNGTLQHAFPEPKAYAGTMPMWTKEQARAYADYIRNNQITSLGDDAKYWDEIKEDE